MTGLESWRCAATEGIRNYGIVPFEAYPGFNYGTEKADFHELSRVLKAYLISISTSWIST